MPLQAKITGNWGLTSTKNAKELTGNAVASLKIWGGQYVLGEQKSRRYNSPYGEGKCGKNAVGFQ